MPTAREMLDPARNLVDLSQTNPAVADVTYEHLVLDGRPGDAIIKDALSCGLERRLDGASNLTLSLTDPAVETEPGSNIWRPKLLNSGIFAKAVDLDLDVPEWGTDPIRRVIHRLAYRLADRNVVDASGVIGLDLTFEATAVARLRTFKGAKHASRNDVTRAEFIKGLCDEAGIPFVCPDLHVEQAIQTPEQALTPAQRKAQRARGSNKLGKGKTGEITIKGQKATAEQLSQIAKAVKVADAEKAPAKAELEMHMAAIGESGYRAVPNSGGSNYWGVFQGAKNVWAIGDTEGMARSFLRGGKGFQGGGAIALAAAHPDWPNGRIALTVEGDASNFGGDVTRGAAFYGAYYDEAVKIMEAFGASGSLDPNANTTTTPEPYAIAYVFKRLGKDEYTDDTGKPADEDSWTCMRRLAAQVGWRLWEELGAIYFMTDDRILRSSVEMTIEPMMDGVYSVSADQSTRKNIQQIIIECDARIWGAGPATVVEVYGYGKPMDGRWITSSVLRPSLWEPHTTVTIQRREAAALEPAHQLGQRAATTAQPKGTAADLGGAGAAGNLASPLSLRGRIVAIATASQTSKTGFRRYSQPGALTANPTPPPPARTDCSQWIRACYLTAGGPDPGTNTFAMSNGGIRTTNPLPGDIMLTADVGHCELYIGGGKTIGHGTPTIDGANIADFAGHFFVTFSQLDTGARSTADVAGSGSGARP